MDGGDAGADGAFSDFELAAAGDERGVSDFYAADIGDGVILPGCAVEGDAEIAGTGRGLGGRESAATEQREENYAGSDHKYCSITGRRQYRAWLLCSRVFWEPAILVERIALASERLNHREHGGGTEDTGKAPLRTWRIGDSGALCGG